MGYYCVLNNNGVEKSIYFSVQDDLKVWLGEAYKRAGLGVPLGFDLNKQIILTENLSLTIDTEYRSGLEIVRHSILEEVLPRKIVREKSWYVPKLK